MIRLEKEKSQQPRKSENHSMSSCGQRKQTKQILEADVSHFADLVEEYMDFLRLEKKLAKDIERRGINYPERMSTGIEKIVNNPSIKDLVSVSKQKQIILEKLGITTEKMVSADGDEL